MSVRKGGRRWTELAKQVIAEEPVCWRCGVRPSTTADHVVALMHGGDEFDRNNLRGACQPCNYRAGAIIGNRERGRRKRAARMVTRLTW